MGCCGRKNKYLGTGGSPLCKVLEEGGAALTVWPMATATGVFITIRIPVGRQIKQVDIFSFMESTSCNGPTARWLRSELPKVRAAVNYSPHLFSSYASGGISLGKLCQISRRPGSNGNPKKLQPHPNP